MLANENFVTVMDGKRVLRQRHLVMKNIIEFKPYTYGQLCREQCDNFLIVRAFGTIVYDNEILEGHNRYMSSRLLLFEFNSRD